MRWLALALLLCSACSGAGPADVFRANCERRAECGLITQEQVATCRRSLAQELESFIDECHRPYVDLYACEAGLECGEYGTCADLFKGCFGQRKQ